MTKTIQIMTEIIVAWINGRMFKSRTKAIAVNAVITEIFTASAKRMEKVLTKLKSKSIYGFIVEYLTLKYNLFILNNIYSGNAQFSEAGLNGALMKRKTNR